MSDGRRYAPHVARNTQSLLSVLRDVLPAAGLVLEVASGSGEQSVRFARAFPLLQWQPSDPDPGALTSIEAWVADAGLPNLREPVALDAASATWPIERAEAMLCINMVHISPWTATLGLLAGAGRLLPAGRPLILYGAYRRKGSDTAPSNEAFDRSLRARNAAWGLRDLEEVTEAAATHGLVLDRVTEMPANNLSVIFRRE